MARPAGVLSHWHLLVEDFNTSALEFYTSVEEELKARRLPDLQISRTFWNEGGVLSAKREYLHVAYGRLSFDLCAAPYGTSFFFSWWLAERPPQAAALYGCLTLLALPIFLAISMGVFGFFKGIFVLLLAFGVGTYLVRNASQSGTMAFEDTILAMPVIGPVYNYFFKPVTYYSLDTRLMFQESVQNIVARQLELLRTDRGLRALTPEEAKPQVQALLT